MTAIGLCETDGMCMQCMGAAVTMVGSATGIRAFVAARQPSWMTPARLKFTTAVLMGGAVIGSGINVG